MQQLYAGYRADLVDTDYAPVGAPLMSAALLGNDLILQWKGIPGDTFEVQVSTNLADAHWTVQSTQVVATGSDLSVHCPVSAARTASWYRIRRLPRLQVPETMVYIQPGTFLMGTGTNDPNKTAYELGQFPVTLTRGFWINGYEVSQSEYQNLTCANPSTTAGNLECPVDNVSWANAINYCALLTARERQALRLPDGYEYRLPTEAEWEYAARAGTTNLFSFGDDPQMLPEYAWYSGNSQSSVHQVGLLQPNAWGLSDMQGNVFEWCWDWITSTPSGPVADFRGSTNSAYHAIRGGAASFPWLYCRCGWRVGYSAISNPIGVGFRVVLAPVDP